MKIIQDKLKQSRGAQLKTKSTLEGLLRQGIAPWMLKEKPPGRTKQRAKQHQRAWRNLGEAFNQFFQKNHTFQCERESFISITAYLIEQIKNNLNQPARQILCSIEDSLIKDGTQHLIDTCRPAFSEYLKQRLFRHKILGTEGTIKETDLEQSELLEIIATYPGLIKCLSQWLINLQTSSSQLCIRLHKDREAINTFFSLNINELKSIKLGQGDHHHNAESTSELKFKNGKSLYYKPRSLALEIQFGTLSKSVCEQLSIPSFDAVPRSLDRGLWGLQEKVSINEEITSCSNELISRLALMIVLIDILGAMDCINENLIICGDAPMLIDGETLLHESGQHPALKHDIDESLIMSGLFESTPPEITQRLNALFRLNANAELQFIQTLKRIYTSPSLTHHIHRFLDQVKSQRCKRRVVLRSTESYNKLLQFKRQAKVMRNPILAEKTYEKLYDIAYQNNAFDRAKFDLAFAEEIQLKSGWIPYFSTRVNSRSIYSFNTKPLRSGHNSRTVNYAKQRLKLRQQGDYQRQIKLIQAALNLFPRETQCTSDLSIDTIREQLLNEAIFYRRWGWLNPSVQHGSQTLVYRRNESLYDGKLGIALFLKASIRRQDDAATTTQVSDIVGSIADETQELIRQAAQRSRTQNFSIGLDGLGGYLLAASILRPHKVEPRSREFISQIRIDPTMQIDILFGMAGLAAGLHAWTNRDPALKNHSGALQLLHTIGTTLLKTQHQQGYWSFENQPQVGFAHGTAGVMAALAIISKRTGLNAHDSIQRALQFELTSLKASQTMIGDQVISSTPHQLMDPMWCRGPAGLLVAMAVLQQAGMTPLPGFEELKGLIQQVLRQRTPDRDQLCCGSPGAAMCIAAAARVMEDDKLMQHSERLKRQWLDAVKAGKPLKSRPLKNGTIMSPPGLFTGRAGLGFFLLDDFHHAALKDQIISCGLLDV